jgi:hypothetical protein
VAATCVALAVHRAEKKRKKKKTRGKKKKKKKNAHRNKREAIASVNSAPRDEKHNPNP